MCGGVTKGLAGVKLSGSPSKFGENSDKESSVINRIVNPNKSLYEK